MLDDLAAGFGPIRAPSASGRVEVAFSEVFCDRIARLLEAGESCMADDIDSQVAEEGFDHVCPRAAGRRRVHVAPWVLGEACANLRMGVGRVVVDDQRRVGISRIA